METFCAPFLNVPFLSEDLLIPLLERPQVCNRFLSPQAKRWSETLALLDSGESDLETALMQLKPMIGKTIWFHISIMFMIRMMKMNE